MAAAFQNAATVISVTVQGTGGFYKYGKTDVIGPFVDDRRVMGVAVADVHLAAAGKQHDIIAHLKQDKPEGWHETDWTDCAWTDGNALLPLEDHLIGHEIALLSITIRAAGTYIANIEKQADSKKRFA